MINAMRAISSFGRAARIIDQLHDAGILGPPDGSKARAVLVGMADLDQY